VFINTAQVIVDNNGTPLGYDEIDGDLYIGSDDLVQQPGAYFNGYISFVGIWKGDLTQPQIINIINNGLAGNANSNLMTDCQLYLNFEEILTSPPLLDLPGITSGAIANAGTPIITYGTDGDGDYIQFEYSGYAPTESIYFTNLPGYITQVEAKYTIKYKAMSPSIFMIVYTTYNSSAIYTNGGNTIQTLVVINAPSNPTVSFQYQSAYSVVGETIRIYSIKVELTNPYKIKDWSPQNREVVLNNYTLAEITPGDPLYRLVNIDLLR
ncbi:MAG TPA: hypothetical protein PLJ60_21310, partial [Chryseolinea sp.]|nr:hypothetical protein [Chryseolinea sp.]